MRDSIKAIKKARRERKLLKKRCPKITCLERVLSGLSAVDAVYILCNDFNFGQAQVEFMSGRKITIDNLRAIVDGHNIDAKEVGPLYFFGGPPGVSLVFKGSLFTMVLDKILYENTIYGSYADLVQ